MKCFNLLFSKNGLIKNIGSYVIILLTLSNIILTVLFTLKKRYLFLHSIDKLIQKQSNNLPKKEIKSEKIKSQRKSKTKR